MDFSLAGRSVLVVGAPGADRDALAEAIRSLGPAGVRMIDHPRAEVPGNDPVSVVLLESGLDDAGVSALLAQEPLADALVIGYGTAADADPHWAALPKDLSDYLAAPIDAGELRFRLARRLREVSAAQDRDEAEEELLFHGVDEEYVTSDPRGGQILEVNRVFLERSGGSEAEWRGKNIECLGLVEDPEKHAEREKRLRIDGEVDFRCRRRYPDGEERPVAVARRMGMRHGRLVYLTRIRELDDDSPAASVGEERADDRLRLLGSILGGRADRKGLARAFAELAQAALGLAHLCVFNLNRKGELKVDLAAPGEVPAELSDARTHAPYRKLLSGQEVVAAHDAGEAFPEDPFIQGRKIAGYVGVPIFSGAGSVAGTIVAASTGPIDDPAGLVSTLRVLAGHFGARGEIRRLRIKSESRNLQDALTGLPNRMLFNDRLDHALKEAQRSGEMVALMFVDLDRFKTINDSLGHGCGDEVLAAVAERLTAGVRKSDTVARYAGDEFTIVLRHINQKDDVIRVAQKINRQLAEPLPMSDGQELQVTASIGISFFPDDGSTGEELLKHADMAMYSAKGMGRNTTQSYVEDTDDSHQQKLMLESKLRSAEKNGELRIFYQPQVSAESEDIVGMEALIRWEHPELGLISPGFFIPLAEETGLIVPIGEWLLRRATRETAEWQRRFGLPLILGVNLSPLQLKQDSLVQVIERALNDAELEPRYLDLEVTESLSIKSIPGLRERLEQCRELGCQISIDDFGTGQASLDYLKRFPADRIKIDQSFVRNIGVDPDDEAIVRATIAMAKSLNLKVIAEGVEEEGHLEFLRANGCGEMQGYLFSRPLPADSFSRLLVEREALTVADAPPGENLKS